MEHPGHRVSRVSGLLLLAAGVTFGARPVPAASGARVIPAYEGLARFADAIEATPAADRAALHQAHVAAPYEEACGVGSGPFQLLGPDTSARDARDIVRQLQSHRVMAIASG